MNKYTKEELKALREMAYLVLREKNLVEESRKGLLIIINKLEEDIENYE